MAAEPLESCTLYDLEDHELLQMVVEETDDKTGYAATADIAKRIGIEGKHPHQSVGGRLAHMKKFNAVSLAPGGKRWQVTQVGRDIIHGKLKIPQQRALQDSTDGEKYLMNRVLASEHPGLGETAAGLSRRVWKRRFG